MTLGKKSKKEEKLFNNVKRVTEEYVKGKAFKGLTEKELFEKLRLPDIHHPLFKEVLIALLEEKILILQNLRYTLNIKKDNELLIQGVIHVHHKGFAFVEKDPVFSSYFKEDVFIPKHLTKNAVDGDRVEIIVNPLNISAKGPEGEVVHIIERGRSHVAGIIQEVSSKEALLYSPLLGEKKKIYVKNPSTHSLKKGDRIIVKVLDWGNKEEDGLAEFARLIGHIDDPSTDTVAAIAEFELEEAFSMDALEEAKSFGSKVSLKEIKARTDLRELETVTIDPDTARDFDDALSLIETEEGFDLYVHIADVSHYVKVDSPLDIDAKKRCNSTYFPGFCLPMLPHELSSHLCSLKPDVNRLTITVLLRFDKTGELLFYDIFKSVIKSKKRFTYKEAKLVLDGKKKSPHLPLLKKMVDLCLLLKQKKKERGNIEFSMPDLVILVDEKGVPYGTDYVSYDITHQLVEEFMVKANEVVATHLTQEGKNLTFRVHETPSPENLKEFSDLALAFGFKIPSAPSVQDLQAFFEEIKESPFAEYLATSYIKRMRLAIYSADNIGHFGLALTHYCHFTSPIRRYVDLVIHRLLFTEIESKEILQETAKMCSEQERISAKAEGSVTALKKLRYIETLHAKEPEKTFKAVITRIKPFGVYFDIIEVMLEGFLHISDVGDDFYHYNDATKQLTGSWSHEVFQAGQKIEVLLKSVDLTLLETKWEIVEKEPSAEETSSRQNRQKPLKERKRDFNPKKRKK